MITENRPPAYWPSSSGGLTVDKLEVKYAPDLPSVLHKISFTVRPAEKIGVVRLLAIFISCDVSEPLGLAGRSNWLRYATM